MSEDVARIRTTEDIGGQMTRFFRSVSCSRCVFFGDRISYSFKRTIPIIKFLICASLITKVVMLVFSADFEVSGVDRNASNRQQHSTSSDGIDEENLDHRRNFLSNHSFVMDPTLIRRQSLRRKHLLDVCRKLNTSGVTVNETVLPPSLLNSIIVDDKHRLLYCRIPKVACTNWKRVLLIMNGVIAKERRYHRLPTGVLRRLYNYSADEIRHRLDTYYKIVFVREPFERLLSAYFSKFIDTENDMMRQSYGRRIVELYRENPTNESLQTGRDVSFEEFVAYLLDPRTTETEQFDIHWRQYSELCHPCLVHYDFIGKFETLTEDADFVLRRLGVRDDVSFPSGPWRRLKTSDVVAAKFSNISSADIHRLWKLYSIDFDLFDYPYPSF